MSSATTGGLDLLRGLFLLHGKSRSFSRRRVRGGGTRHGARARADRVDPHLR
jgi:hypothetical protein